MVKGFTETVQTKEKNGLASSDDSPLLDDIPWVVATDCAALLWVAATGDSVPSAEWRPVSQWDDLAGGMSRGTTDSKILGKCG